MKFSHKEAQKYFSFYVWKGTKRATYGFLGLLVNTRLR